MPLKPSYLFLLGGGAIVAIAGVKGYAPSKVLRDIISGQNPSANPTLTSQITPQTYNTQAPLNTLGPAGTTGGSAGGIVGLAQSHPLPYQWAGDPSKGVADCSSWVNYIVGALAGLSIPGYPNGSYHGNGHGPNTLAWLAWGAAGGMTKISRANVQGGNLCIWQTHMGIAVDNNTMISDLNPSDGVKTTSIDGTVPGEVLFCWALK